MSEINRRTAAQAMTALLAGLPMAASSAAGEPPRPSAHTKISDREDAPPIDGATWTVEDQRPFQGQTRRLKITRNGRFVTALILPTDYPTHFRLKPELLPVCSPTGIPATGSHEYCFIHHQSVMCGHGGVVIDGQPGFVDFYRQLSFVESNRRDPFRGGGPKNLFTEGPSGLQRVTDIKWSVAEGHVRLDLELEWQTRHFNQERGETLILESRRYDIFQWGDATLVDLSTRLAPARGPLTLRADRHSLIGVRVHDLIDVEDGGTMQDSLGRMNPQGNYWDPSGDRAAPRWVDCTGHIGSQSVGVCLLPHPLNAKNEFYVREFGLMTVSPTLGQAVRLTAEEPLRFAARFAVHDGVLSPAMADSWLRHFADTPLMHA